MARMPYHFDAGEIAESGDFEPIPAGNYQTVIIDSEFRTARRGGRYLELKFRVNQGEHQGRLLWLRLILQHPNQMAVSIAQRQLAAIGKAVGKIRFDDTSVLHNLPLIVKVEIEPPRDGFEAGNIITGFAPVQRQNREESSWF